MDIKGKKVPIGEIYKCECGALISKKNLASHKKTKKHMALTGQIPFQANPRHNQIGDIVTKQLPKIERIPEVVHEEDEEEEEVDTEEILNNIDEVLECCHVLDQKLNILNSYENKRNTQMEEILALLQNK